MKAKIFCLFFLIVLEFIVCPQNGWTQDNTIPMIGAYYFDGWSGKNNSQELWAQEAPTHLTEKLYNDYNERQPIWGWRNDDLAIMERQIDIASQNGITFFLFCWYWKKDKGEMDIKSIENHASHTSLKLFMKARNKHKMKFALLIANHQGARIEGEDNWLKAMDYMAETYFQDSQYLKVENKPVVAFFNAKAAAPSLAKMNDYLKTLGKLCNIDAPTTITYYKGNERIEEILPKYELLSSHIGRRTFICNALMLGIAPNIVMKWTGHSDYAAMKPYIEIADKAKETAMSLFNKI